MRFLTFRGVCHGSGVLAWASGLLRSGSTKERRKSARFATGSADASSSNWYNRCAIGCRITSAARNEVAFGAASSGRMLDIHHLGLCF